MANVARGLKPLEKEWIRPEDATDSIVTGYDWKVGFAEGKHPITYTLDLGKPTSLRTIRFLLWDVKNTRQYYYSLSLSDDNETWNKYYETGEKGFNGWQVFFFPRAVKAKFVRLDCKFNTENDGFHIVEFEVHDSEPSLKMTGNVTNERILFEPLIDNNVFVNQLTNFLNTNRNIIAGDADKVLKKIISDGKEVEVLKEQLKEKQHEFEKTIVQLNLTGKSLNFQQESNRLDESAKNWLKGTIVSFIVFVFLVISFLCSSTFHFKPIAEEITKSSMYEELVTKTVLFEFFSFLIVKILLVSLSIYAFVFCAKNYKAQKHNYTINQHKAMSLFAAVELLDNEKLSMDTKEKFLTQAANAIFSHQRSGYNTKDADFTSGIGSVLEKGKD